MDCPGIGKHVGAVGGVMGQIQEGVVIPPPPSVLLWDTSKLTRNLLGDVVAILGTGAT